MVSPQNANFSLALKLNFASRATNPVFSVQNVYVNHMITLPTAITVHYKPQEVVGYYTKQHIRPRKVNCMLLALPTPQD